MRGRDRHVLTNRCTSICRGRGGRAARSRDRGGGESLRGCRLFVRLCVGCHRRAISRGPRRGGDCVGGRRGDRRHLGLRRLRVGCLDVGSRGSLRSSHDWSLGCAALVLRYLSRSDGDAWIRVICDGNRRRDVRLGKRRLCHGILRTCFLGTCRPCGNVPERKHRAKHRSRQSHREPTKCVMRQVRAGKPRVMPIPLRDFA